MDKPDDTISRKLWNDFLSGDREAFGKLYNDFARQLYEYGLRFTSNKELVKDCVQDLFVKLYTGRKRLKPVENVKVYLYCAMKNMLFNLFKKEKNYYQIDTIEPVFQVEFSAETALIEAEELYEQKKRILLLMENVTPRQREVIYYRFMEELSYEEICKLMQMNYQSVRNLLHRTILKIRSTITGDAPE